MFQLPRPSNDNYREVAAGCGYYPEMGERAPSAAIITASLSHYGRHYYIKFAEADAEKVLGLIKAAKLRFSDYNAWTSVKGERKVDIRMTCAAYDKFRKLHRDICTSEMLLD